MLAKAIKQEEVYIALNMLHGGLLLHLSVKILKPSCIALASLLLL